MNRTNPAIVVDRQIPEHIRTHYPKFVEFIRAYYSFLSETQLLDLDSVHSIDAIDLNNSKFLDSILYDKFKQEYAKNFPIFAAVDKKMLMKHLRDFYLARGSEQSFIFLFRALFNSDLSIEYPVNNILRPSDGRWTQEQFVTITRVGTVEFPQIITEFEFLYYGITKTIPITRFILIDSNTLRLYFDYKEEIIVSEEMLISFPNSLAKGTVILSPQRIIIEEGGSDWQLGQIVRFPSSSQSGTPTIAQVTNVGQNGSMTEITIIDHGYPHVDNTIVLVEPYPAFYAVPYTYNIELNGSTYTHTIDIVDQTRKTNDTVTVDVSSNSGLFPSMYYSQDYSSEYYAKSEIAKVETQTIPVPIIDYRYNSTKAKLKILFGLVSKTQGRWTTDDSKVSNQNIRLQDDFYYQQFSYVLNSDANPETYAGLIGSLHVAGTIQFRKFSVKQIQTNNVKPETVFFRNVFFDFTEMTSSNDTAIPVDQYKKYMNGQKMILTDFLLLQEDKDKILQQDGSNIVHNRGYVLTTL